ncbi:MAG: MBOAT family protein [Anaerolineales bacterium]|nr:MBOAT family protein [Anaerolineales bacterium]
MQFASLQFLLFLPIAAFTYFRLPQRHRWMILLLASGYFYFSFIPTYILLALPLALLDFGGALALERTAEPSKHRLYLSLVAAHVVVLIVFKYSNFTAENLNAVFNFGFSQSSWLVPVGLSYQTLMSISYLSEVNAGRLAAAQKPQTVMLYLLFFPQLLAGPIERPQNTMPQFEAAHAFDYARVSDGLKRMAYGFFKKLVIADRLALIVGTVYGDVQTFDGPQLMLATALYAWQIYCDFSGYTDIALGTAQIFGIRLTENFRQPYFSRSVTEFWQRWHISLSTWLRDYLYFPMARRLRSPQLRWLALFATFLASGLWHGAAWTFVVWGAMHGLYLVIELWVKTARGTGGGKPPSGAVGVLQTVFTFGAVSFAWIFFRAANLNEAVYVVTHLFNGVPVWVSNFTNTAFLKDAVISMGFSLSALVIILTTLPILLFLEGLQAKEGLRLRLNRQKPLVRWALYYLLVVAIAFLGVYGESGFIYFQF